MEFKHNLIFDNKKYELTVDYVRAMQVLPKIPQEIGSKLFKNEDYTVKSQVPVEVFQGFLNYWKDSKLPEINSNNLYEYNLLSEEFGIMKDYLTEHRNEDDFHLSSLKYLSNLYEKSTISDKSEHERYIALHLDSFLEKREAEILKIPINSLYNIFFHKERVLNDQQKAFNFINENKNKDSNLLILLPSLEAEQLNHNDLINTISNAQANFGFIPNIPHSIFDSYDDQINQLKEKNKTHYRTVNLLIGCLLFETEKTKIDDYKEIISVFLYEDLDVNTIISYENESNRYKLTPLSVAIMLGDIELVKYLIAKPEIDLNAKSIYMSGISLTDFTYEIFNDEKEKIECEIIYKIDEKSPLYLAIEEENIEIVKLLLNCPQIDVNEKNISEFDVIIPDSAELSSSALKLLESITQSPETIIKSKESLKKTIKFARKRSETDAFHYAIERNDIEIIKLLLSSSKLDINIKSASMNDYIEAKIGSKQLCNRCNDYKEKSALVHAIEEKNIEIINCLLARPELDVNNKSIEITSMSKISLLATGFFASDQYSLPLLSSLSELKIPFDKQIIEFTNKKGEFSALYCAIAKENFEITKLLLSRKDLDINSQNHFESYFKLEISESDLLKIQEKAPKIAEWINIEKHQVYEWQMNHTALHRAVMDKNAEIIEALLENKGIDVKVTDEHGKMPIDRTDKKEIIALFNNLRH